MSKFDLDKFNEENPIIDTEAADDPFVEKVNGREAAEPLTCWYCGGVFDRVTGERIAEADPEGEDVASLREMCSGCLTVVKVLPSYVEL